MILSPGGDPARVGDTPKRLISGTLKFRNDVAFEVGNGHFAMQTAGRAKRGYEGRDATLEIAASRDATGQSYEWRRVMKLPCRLLAAAALAVGTAAFAAPADAAVTTAYGNKLSAQAVATPQRASLRNPRGRQEQETIRFRETAAASPFSPWGIGLILGIGF
jgi:hypothetical protein